MELFSIRIQRTFQLVSTLELELNLENIIPYLDKVFNKVSSNLACYIEDLRQNKLLEEY